ncbi:outer membrane beta-barrel protein [Aureibacter tunicatorum]|uniref:Opacity protein-like surface antigen n=1 Tax=Aureibacter tunicatorum TaxID=866807 RepID=A0AAE4BRS2_9BACT|nr:outer membrane beta-barrel protein [Aureibacter tunicatorum]MDR6238976.1 opacity protein-like surface antigen [Aureibacter tunicatorum]
MKKGLLLILAIVLGYAQCMAQDSEAESNWYISAQYSMSFPVGEFHDIYKDPDFKGFWLEGGYLFDDFVSVGLTAAFHQFSKGNLEVRETSIVVDDFNTLLIPILVKGNIQQVFGKFKPYLGIGGGGAFSKASKDVLSYGVSESTRFTFAFMGELGLNFQLVDGVDLNVAGKYEYYDVKVIENRLNYFSANIGIRAKL